MNKILYTRLLISGIIVLIGVGAVWGEEIVAYLQLDDNVVESQPISQMKEIPEQPLLNENNIDISDWKTYRNEELGIEFKYPDEWGNVIIKFMDESKYVKGKQYILKFTNDSSRSNGDQITAHIFIKSIDYRFEGPTDGSDISINKIDLEKSNTELLTALMRPGTVDMFVQKITISDKKGVYIKESFVYLDGNEYELVYYIFPKYDKNNLLNFVLSGDIQISNYLNLIVGTLSLY